MSISLPNITRVLEEQTPFTRKIQPDEIWLYRNPRTEDYVPGNVLWPMVLTIPAGIFLIYFFYSRDRTELWHSVMGWTLALGLNGILTDILKLTVGKSDEIFGIFFAIFLANIYLSSAEKLQNTLKLPISLYKYNLPSTVCIISDASVAQLFIWW